MKAGLLGISVACLSGLLGTSAALAQAPAVHRSPPSLPPAAAVASAAAIGCPSLANLRILLHLSEGSAVTAAASLADPKADHLGCVLLARDTVTAVADHAALNGSDYDCVAITGTSICHWTIAGTVVPVDPSRAAKKAPPAKPKR